VPKNGKTKAENREKSSAYMKSERTRNWFWHSAYVNWSRKDK